MTIPMFCGRSNAILRSQYGAEYRVIGSDLPEGALDLLKQLKVRNDSVALLLADQRMPRMDGVEFLQEAMRIFPDAKRALLTAYADTTAAISAINQANINYFFMKPWDPPTEHLYPQLDDLLDDWQASYRPAFRGNPGVGHALVAAGRTSCAISWRATTCRINGLTSNFPPTIRKPSGFWKHLGPEAANLPVVLFPDGTKLLESVPARCRAESWTAHPRANQLLRFGDCGWRARRSGGGRLWGVGRPAYRDG